MSNEEICRHAGRYEGRRALIVLGGRSASSWEDIYWKVRPDIIIGVNGVNRKITGLDYWLCMENMGYPHKMEGSDERYADIMEMYRTVGANCRIVNKKTAHLIPDQENLIALQRRGVEVDELKDFSFREYGGGYINGARMQRPDVIKDLRAGTVALQAIHHAGILGCAEIHTVGFDLCLTGQHHWYEYPPYAGNRFYGENMFTHKHGLRTLWFWVDTVEYMKSVIPALERDDILWRDHSGGLMGAAGLKCSV